MLECASVRVPVTLFLVAVAAASSARADLIHLKNGRSIWADHVRENGTRVEYDIGDDSYAVPKNSVEKIEAGGVPPQYASASASKDHDVPAFAPTSNLKNESIVSDKVIRDGKVDVDALNAVEQGGDASASAAAYFIAGKHEFETGNFVGARKYFETALRFDSQNPTVLNYYAALLVRTGNPVEALLYAERAARVAPDSADTLAVLGYAQFASDRTADAIRSWKRSLSLRPDAMIQHYLEKAQREASAESDFSQRESGHFTLKYEGKQTSDSLRRGVIDTLESEYDDLTRELGIAPRGSISVTLYTDQAFFDVTQAPSWSGAVNDGKLRIPVDGVSAVTPELARVLKHELAHSFINHISGGRCPQWLNEGVAQVLEPKSLASHGRRLAQIFKAQQEIPYNVLEGSFMQFSTVQAMVAYDESLAAVEYINETYGMSDIRRILERLGQGSSTEAALRATVHSDYGQMETEVGKYLTDKFGD